MIWTRAPLASSPQAVPSSDGLRLDERVAAARFSGAPRGVQTRRGSTFFCRVFGVALGRLLPPSFLTGDSDP